MISISAETSTARSKVTFPVAQGKVSVQNWGDMSNWRRQNPPISPFRKGGLRGIFFLIAQYRLIHLTKPEQLQGKGIARGGEGCIVYYEYFRQGLVNGRSRGS